MTRVYHFNSMHLANLATSNHTLVEVVVFYMLCAIRGNIQLDNNVFSLLNIARNSFINMLSFTILMLLSFSNHVDFWPFILIYSFLCFAMLILLRMLERRIIMFLKSYSSDKSEIVLLGSSSNLMELSSEMNKSVTHKYVIRGYFDETPNPSEPDGIPYLGTPGEFDNYVRQNNVTSAYCALPSNRKDIIKGIIKSCENNFVYFYSVPNVRNYLNNPMSFRFFGDVPVLSLHDDPLAYKDARFVKRAFDLIITLPLMVTIFPILYVIVGLIIKITSHGPIFFKQERTGYQGKVFMLYKFRSMKVNKDSDTLQATKDDPRKTKFGNFLRASNIDEIPQLINVLKGDMSIIGPRPHMLKHTEEYSAVIGKFMVRHFIKPGITGWAQVTGCRGETRTVADMEKRVKADIWYMDHWSIWLDIYIILKTFKNIIVGDKQAY